MNADVAEAAARARDQAHLPLDADPQPRPHRHRRRAAVDAAQLASCRAPCVQPAGPRAARRLPRPHQLLDRVPERLVSALSGGGRSRGEDRLFPDWVCVCIEPDHLWRDETLFCPRNAAAPAAASSRPASRPSRAVRRAGRRRLRPDFVRTPLLRAPARPTSRPRCSSIATSRSRTSSRSSSRRGPGEAEFSGLEQLGRRARAVRVGDLPGVLRAVRAVGLLQRGKRPVEANGIIGRARCLSSRRLPQPRRGAMLAAAVGDALGWPQENRAVAGRRAPRSRA